MSESTGLKSKNRLKEMMDTCAVSRKCFSLFATKSGSRSSDCRSLTPLTERRASLHFTMGFLSLLIMVK